MFRRRQENPKANVTVRHVDELNRLKAQVARLEQAIAQLALGSNAVHTEEAMEAPLVDADPGSDERVIDLAVFEVEDTSEAPLVDAAGGQLSDEPVIDLAVVELEPGNTRAAVTPFADAWSLTEATGAESDTFDDAWARAEVLGAEFDTSFADAWSRAETTGAEYGDFFDVGEVDKRARRWLLSSN